MESVPAERNEEAENRAQKDESKVIVFAQAKTLLRGGYVNQSCIAPFLQSRTLLFNQLMIKKT